MNVRTVTLTTMLMLVPFSGYVLGGCKPKAAGGVEEAVAEKVKVDFYLMSQCPHGTHVQQGIKPVLDRMGAYVDYAQNFIAPRSDNESKGNIAQLCMAKYFGKGYKYMDAVVCMANDRARIPDNWKDCATKHGLDVTKLQGCIDGEEGKNLLAESMKKSTAANARACPTIYIGGEKYVGGRTDKDFETAICCAFTKPENRPKICASDLVCPKPVDLIVLSDKRCPDCEQRSEMMVQNFKDRIPKLNVRKVDYMDPEGKELFEKTKVGMLPAYLFAQNFKEGASYQQFQRWVREAGDYLVMMVVGSTFDPTKEICDNGIDDTANNLIDCDDPDCRGQVVCREEKPNSLDLFVMSMCPHGIRPVNAMKEVLDNFKGGLNFGLHFIVDVMTEEEWGGLPEVRKHRCVRKDDGNYYCSLNGEDELNENLRQACAIKYYSKGHKYMDYILCRNQNIRDPDWKKCVTQAKLDVAKIEKCSTGKEGLALIQAGSKLAKELNFTGSPSFLVNNRHVLRIMDRSPEGIKTAICNLNKGLKGCENTLSGAPAPGAPAQPAAPAGSCG